MKNSGEKELSPEKQQEMINEAIETIALILKIHNVPAEYKQAIIDAYQAGSVNALRMCKKMLL